jgi:hypothetical protein
MPRPSMAARQAPSVVFVTLYDLNARLHLQITAGNRDLLVTKLPGADCQGITKCATSAK